jgi:hypothetical protein
MPNSETNTGLVVPVDMTAFCVGINDQQLPGGTRSFAGATTTFTNQIGQNNAFLGSNVIIPLSESPLNQLTAGIHVHWALPEALTRGNYSKESTKLSFALVPNRWLLSRIVVNGSNVARKSWIIESDTLQESAPAGRQFITLPVKTVNVTEKNYRYVGKPVPFTAEWTDPGNQVFENLTGNKLSAVSSGDVSFAAYYPNSSNIFGFYDDMSDIPTGDNAGVMYQVTGWFSNPQSDPLNGGKTLKAIQETYGWTFTDAAATPSHSLYSSMVQTVEWNINRDYVLNQPDRKPVKGTITVGNNPPEAFSAYFRDMLHQDNSFFEQLLNAFQIGLLSEFKQPKPDQLAQMEEIIYQKEFAGASSGTVYSVAKMPPDEYRKSLRQDEAPDNTLPLDLAEALNLLNVYQQQVDFFSDYTARFQWQLFSDWYRLMKADDNTKRNNLSSLIGMGIRDWSQMLATAGTLDTKLKEQLARVKAQISALGPDMILKADPAPRYWQANEPVVLLTTDGSGVLRYGQVGKDNSGYLPCRLTAQLLTAIAVNSVNITAQQFASIALPGPNKLPDSAIFNALVEEACMLNTDLVSAITKVPSPELETGLKRALEDETQSLYTFSGQLPAGLAVKWWRGNAWYPILLHWEMTYAPLQPTQTAAQLLNYPPQFFTSNYSIDQDAGGRLHYTGSADPKTILAQQGQSYKGTAVLSPSAAESFEAQLNDYLDSHTDETLALIRDTLKKGGFFSAALNGFNSALLMREQNIQLTVNVGPGSPYMSLTNAVARIVGQQNTASPMPYGYFNPIRAGYMQPQLVMVDVYGQKRKVDIEKIICADSLTTRFNNTIEPGIVYMPARLSQPARLMFRWLSATGDAIEEMNAHPATTPVCGWIMPNHLDGSLFIYNQQGKAMGTLMLNGNKTAILWQSAPGDNKTINKNIEEIFEFENPQLAAFAIALRYGPPKFFIEFSHSIDSMSNFVNPQNYAQSSDMAVLIGRPVAITQVMLRIEMEGGPNVNQSWLSVTQQEYNTDNGTGQVQFPVILGDLSQINDGLLGYFLPGKDSYDFSTFYSEAASGNNGVVKPTPTTIRLTASPKTGAKNPENQTADALTILMLVDPRATIHATTGILPTKNISIPSDQYMDTLSILEMTFLTTPVLKGVTGFNLPVPKEAGYDWSWVQAVNFQLQEQWTVTPNVDYDLNQAIADYTPQTLNEGWLRLNPQLLEFAILNSSNQPQAQSNAANNLRLTMTNKKPVELEFKPGQLVNEGSANTGSVLYIHFGRMAPQDKVPLLNISADGWQFKSLSDKLYGNYWVATPLRTFTMGAGTIVNFNLTNLITANLTGQVQVYVDYYNIDGVNDGVNGFTVTLTAENKTTIYKNKAYAT